MVPIPTPAAHFIEALGRACGGLDLAQQLAAIVQCYLAELCGKGTPWPAHERALTGFTENFEDA
jgi:hypothetical protein